MEPTNLQYFAKGGGCFLEGTLIGTPDGDVPIEQLKVGDKVLSYNEATKKQEVSTIGGIDVLRRDYYYIINGVISVTAEHPFYTTKGIKDVKDLKIGDKLVGRYDAEIEIVTIKVIDEEVTVYNLLDVLPNNNYYAGIFLVHNKGGGCFLSGTTIKTPNGDTAIDDLKPGDKIYSMHEETKTIEQSTVEKIVSLRVQGYYVINNELAVTATHPVYTDKGIKLVSELKVGDNLINFLGEPEPIKTMNFYDVEVVVYNLIDVVPNHNYFAENYLVHNKGGSSCFLAGTEITLSNGHTKRIEKIKPQDVVMSYNEEDGEQEYAKVETVQVRRVEGYYILNNHLKVTAKHPIYVDNKLTGVDMRQVAVEDLRIGDQMVTDAGWQKLSSIVYVDKVVTVYNLINVVPNHNYYANYILVHNKGGSVGGRASTSTSSGAKSSSTSTSKSSSTSSSTTASKPAAPKVGTSTAKPGSKVTVGGKEIQTSTKKPTNTRFTRSSGVVGDNGYYPRFRNGYNAPAGSVAYRRDTDFIDYLPWIYLFGHSNAAPANQQVTIVQPDGKEVTAQPEQNGVDGLAIFNWIFIILIVVAIIGGAIWGVNKLTNKDKNKPKPSKPSYGW